MNLIIDTNIVISALMSPTGWIARLILNRLDRSKLYAPRYLLIEIENHKGKIIERTGYTAEEFIELLQIITRKIEFIDDKLIPVTAFKKAYLLTKDVDEKDTVFVALAIHTNFKIWTGDKELTKGLKKKGFNLFISTKKLEEELE